MVKCLVCADESKDVWWPYTCSEICFIILTQARVHKDKPCWISEEIFCQRKHCFDRANNDKCQVFKMEESLMNQGQRGQLMIMSYYY